MVVGYGQVFVLEEFIHSRVNGERAKRGAAKDILDLTSKTAARESEREGV